ncbi:hypothetical protein [Microvirga antarctica]|uniref:hypothetical protein n=1 Tax=Microvirga antarctica TaxID=2819233 RepID=UPI001B3171FC|nr:hypothetical protein [Microvirga antarctica]
MAFPYPLDIWQAFVKKPKTVFGWPDWDEGKLSRESKKDAQRAGRQPFYSEDAERLTLRVLLDDGSGAAIEGAGVRIMVWKHHLLRDMTAILEISHEGKSLCISRVDVAPTSPHANKHWRRFNCLPEIAGSHHHPFYENALLGRQAFPPEGNLQVAVPIDEEPQSFRDFMKVVGTAFNVQGLEDLRRPPVQESML